MITYTRPVAGNLPIKTLVARQLQTKWCTIIVFLLLISQEIVLVIKGGTML